MENKIYDVLVNFDGAGSISSDPIVMVKGDYNSVTLKFQMSKKDYLLAMFYLIKPNGLYYANIIENDEITFDDINTFSIEGYYHYGIALYDADSKLTNSAKGIIKVVDNETQTISEGASEDNQYPILDALINRVLEMKLAVDQTVSDIETYNKNANEKLKAFNQNYDAKINNVNANILQIQENSEGTTGITFSEWGDSKRIEEHLKNHFAITSDYNVYTVRFPLFDTSHTCTGEKLDDNADKYCNPATDTVKEDSNYSEAWKSYDVNAVVDENGVRHIIAIKGMPNYKDKGKVDVFCLFRTYWQKIWIENGYIYISRCFFPKEGYIVVSQAINKDGSINPWFLIGKYAVGTIDGILYSSKGLAPAHYVGNNSPYSNNISYNDCVNKMHKKGKYYSAGLMSDYMHILTTFYLKFATKNTQSILAGNTFNSFQYKVATAETNVTRVILTTEQASHFDKNVYVSVGDPTTNSNKDRNFGYMHNIAYNVKVIDIETIDSSKKALILDCEPFDTTSTTFVSTMHEVSGYSDYIQGRTGSIGSNTNGKHGMVLDGIEIAVGGYEVAGNAFMDIIDATGKRDIYITNNASLLTTNVATAKSTYKKIESNLASTAGSWKYITDMMFDMKNGIYYPNSYGESGSGTSTGYADGYIADNGTSGQREYLLLGALYSNGLAGLSCAYGTAALHGGSWNVLARLSINGVGGELTE